MNIKAKTGWIILIIAIVFITGWSGRGQSASEEATNKAWEYKVIHHLNEQKLNELGAEGWELVTVLPAISSGSSTGVTTFYLKRAK